mmetsp:Transcript_15795/g.32381  ORF Transcript_15795/g.32381 Transcript_15795/m.32381 type:complete len:290 (-) Transcript_15795:4-873(-)
MRAGMLERVPKSVFVCIFLLLCYLATSTHCTATWFFHRNQKCRRESRLRVQQGPPELLSADLIEPDPIQVPLHAAIVLPERDKCVPHDLRRRPQESLGVEAALRQRPHHGLVVVHLGVHIRAEAVVLHDVLVRHAQHRKYDRRYHPRPILPGRAVERDGMAGPIGAQVQHPLDPRRAEPQQQLVEHGKASVVDLAEEGCLDVVARAAGDGGGGGLEKGADDVALAELGEGAADVLELVHDGDEVALAAGDALGAVDVELLLRDDAVLLVVVFVGAVVKGDGVDSALFLQ